MALIKTVSPDEATGKVKEVYDVMMEKARVIPKPFQMMSPSPALLEIMLQSLGYYFEHPSLSFQLLTHIRLLVAQAYKYEYCVDFNSDILQMLANVTDEQLDNLKSDPKQAPLNDKDMAMLLFVLKAVKTPDSVDQKDVDALHELEWTDQDIIEATHHGADMVRHGILFKTFKMD
ncbi:MAG: hypothetical protein U9R43_14295 [Thermodesulfobacteriota bacterium]|nr:hypothetical protein [Thermodesulfobacteriota bacterium]